VKRRLNAPVRRRIVRQAHPIARHRQAHPIAHHHRTPPVLAILVGLIVLGSAGIGSVAGAADRDAAVGPAPAIAPTAIPTRVPPTAETAAPATSPRTEEAVDVRRSQDAGDPSGRRSTAARPRSLPAVAIANAPMQPAAIRAEPPGAPRPVAAFLGDSYATGWAGAGNGASGWPAIVGRAYGWRTRNYAVAGTGFVNPGWTGQPIRSRVAAVIRLQPGVIFVAGGHNDRRFGAAASGRAAATVLRRLREGVPDAVIVVIGPIWQDGSPPASLRGLRDRLRREAAEVGAVFIDPLRDGWFTGSRQRFIAADGIHPTQAGHRHMAHLVLARLRADGRFGG
jgi:lysophospholipase L1-like esterase